MIQTQIDQLYVALDNHPLSEKAKRNGLRLRLSAHYLDVIKGKKIIRVALKHFVYINDIVESFEYYFDAVDSCLFQDFDLVDYSSPGFHKVLGFDLMPVFFPSFSEPVVTTNQYLKFAGLKPGGCVLDLGAYSGLTSIIFKEAVGSLGKVVAVEADSENVQAIRTNLGLYKKISGLSIDVLYGAVWNHCNGLSFSVEGNMGSSAAEIVGFGRGNPGFVKSYTLARICEISEIDSIDFIKCDVEGAESVIFEDEEFFSKNRPRIIVEPHYKDGVETTDKCIADLSKYGYECKKIKQSGVELPLLECYP